MYIPLLSAVAPAAPDLASRLAARALFTPRGRRTSPRGNTFLATGVREDHTINGQRIATWRWPSIGAAPDQHIALLLHGWGGSAAQFAAIAPALVARGVSVLAIDGPGHGHSSGRDSSIPAMRDVLIELGRREKGPISIVGHSGGAVAAALAVASGLETLRLAFVGPTIDPGALMEQQALSSGFSPALLAGVKRRTEERFRLPWTALRILPLAAARSEPLLVVHDREDNEVPWQEGADLADAWPRARLLLTHGLGHRRILYDRVAAETVANFIAGTDL
jgi:pimeloyl-ACP methyl ester carboxylesterase